MTSKLDTDHATDYGAPYSDEDMDKYAKFKVPFSTNESHEEDEWDKEHDGKIADWHNRHQDKLLDKFCDNHPGAPQCKVFDD